MLIKSTILSLTLCFLACSAQNIDRQCGENVTNLWLDVVAVVDNSKGMTNQGLTSIAANIASVFSQTRIGSNSAEARTTRVALVTYNGVATVVADLDKYQSIDDLYGIFDVLSSVSSSTESYLANGLAAAEQLFINGQASAPNRTHYQKVVVVYASAYKGTGDLDPVPVADRLKTSGASIVTVAYDQDGDGALLRELSNIANVPYNFSNTDDGSTIGEIQGALLQVNCFCPNNWIQYRQSFTDKYSYRYGVCIQPVGINAVWRAAKMSCKTRWRETNLVTEYDQNKHDFVLLAVKTNTGFKEPFTYHIGLNQVNGVWQWDQSNGTQLDLTGWTGWNPGYPTVSSTALSVLNIQPGSAVTTGWQNVPAMTTGANYVCETVSCDTENYCSSVN